MPIIRANLRFLTLIISFLMAMGLACNAPIGNATPEPSETPTNPPMATTTQMPTNTLSAPETVPSGAASATADSKEASDLPTFTPIQPTLAATLTPTKTPTRPPVPTGTHTPIPTSNVTQEPLIFTYEINWRIGNEKDAIATVSFYPKGGGGEYTYYRDDLPVDGPEFEYRWATCAGNPGSLRVDSADGQTSRVNYFERAPCLTATPHQ